MHIKSTKQQPNNPNERSMVIPEFGVVEEPERLSMDNLGKEVLVNP